MRESKTRKAVYEKQYINKIKLSIEQKIRADQNEALKNEIVPLKENIVEKE